MDRLKNMFQSLNRDWLIRHYLFGFAFYAFFVFTSVSQVGRFDAKLLILLPCALLYPFAMFVYESLVNFIVGDNVFFISGLLMLAWKVFRFVIIWVLAVPIGLIGFIYLYFVYGRQS